MVRGFGRRTPSLTVLPGWKGCHDDHAAAAMAESIFREHLVFKEICATEPLRLVIVGPIVDPRET